MTEEVVLVTGVSGYIGSHVAKVLLEEGWRVRGTVRSLEDTQRCDALKALVPDAKHPLELVEADLTKDDGWDKAVMEAVWCVHCASLKGAAVGTDGQAEATKRLLAACAAAKTLKRVVITSCINSVCADPTPEADKVYNEEDWTDPESPTIDSYSKSKTVAEKAAWDFVKELPDDQKFELSVINPSFVMGPPLLESQKSSTSVNFMAQMVNRSVPGVVRMAFPMTDVRDVAKAHVKALTAPEAANNRHIVSTDTIWIKDAAATLSKEFKPQGYSIPTGQLPYFVCWVAGLFNKNLKTNILPRIGKQFNVDNKRMVEVLGVEPTAIESTLHDMVYALVDLGIVKKAKKYKLAGSRAEVPVVNGDVEEEKKDENKEETKEGTDDKEEEKKELEPEDKEKKEGEEIKEESKEEEKVEENKDNKESEEAVSEEKKEESVAEK